MAQVDFPDAALEWLMQGCDGAILTLAATHGLPRRLARAGRDVVVLGQETKRAAGLMFVPHLTTVVARPEALPFASYHFGGVFVHQRFAHVAPGLALPELARVLRPDGVIAASFFCRDDSVPWVRRLVALMRTVDPDAMPADAPATAMAPLLTSKYFTRQATRDFRIWVPISRAGMLDMVTEQEAVAALDEAARTRLLDEVGAIYDGAARAAELRLPYQLRCWRARVDQAELTHPVRLRDDGLVITF